MIEDITLSAFPSIVNASDERFNDMYIYTTSVYNIIFNSDYSILDVSKKVLKLQLKRFKVFIEYILLFKN